MASKTVVGVVQKLSERALVGRLAKGTRLELDRKMTPSIQRDKVPSVHRKVICTVGPASLKPRIIRRLQALGVSLFRINLSHTPLEEVRPAVAFLQKHTTVPVCLDSEGAQIRTGTFATAPINLRKGSLIEVRPYPVCGDAQKFNFAPPAILELLQPGDLITIDFHAVVAEVMEIEGGRAVLRILKGGRVGNNKACNLHREIELPAITVKDRKAIEIGREMASTISPSPSQIGRRMFRRCES